MFRINIEDRNCLGQKHGYLEQNTFNLFIYISNNKIMHQSSQKKLISIFKTFFQKAIAPQIRKFQGSLSQWVKFSNLLQVQNLNYHDLQMYVDSLPTLNNPSLDKIQVMNKKSSEGDNNDSLGFNPSKTFGGERAKINIFPYQQDRQQTLDTKKQMQKEQSLRQRVNQNNNLILSNLQKLLKILQQNQKVIENPNKDGSYGISGRLNRQQSFQQGSSTYVGSTNSNNSQSNGGSSQSYNYIQTSSSQNQNYIGSHSQNHSHSQPHSNQSQSHMPSTGGNPIYPKNHFP